MEKMEDTMMSWYGVDITRILEWICLRGQLAPENSMNRLLGAGGGIRTHEGLCHRVLSLAPHDLSFRVALPLRPDSGTPATVAVVIFKIKATRST